MINGLVPTYENDYLIKYAKKRYANYGVINIQKFLHIYFCACFFCIFIFVHLIKMTI